MENSKKVEENEQHEYKNEGKKSSTSMIKYFEEAGAPMNKLPQHSTCYDFHSKLLGTIIKVVSISRGHIICSFTVLPPLGNFYKVLHGAAVASVAEKLAIACARTMVTEEKPLFLGELSISYLSGAPINATLISDASVVKSGRNLSVVSMEFRLKETKKLTYTAQAIFFHIPTAKL